MQKCHTVHAQMKYLYIHTVLIVQFAKKTGQRPWAIVHGLETNFVKNGYKRIVHFYNFFDTYTCSYVVF